ncbi:hypothetical protein M0805_008418 [Coniferiporia weirii]|nr:hypothetical protein M0805_008418 [Coniferiporia weirii]
MSATFPVSLLATFLCWTLLGGLQWRLVAAQITSNATCIPRLALFNNSRGQIPCLVGAYLGGACNNGQYDVSELGHGKYYIGPTAALANPCVCSTVMYAVMSACGACQNASEVLTWDGWSAECPTVSIMTFPEDIPKDTAVPGWAYENNTVTGFDPQSAINDPSPESSASSSPASTSSSAPTQGNSNSSSANDTVTVVGAVLGCVGGLILLGSAALFLIRRGERKHGHVEVISSSDDPEESCAQISTAALVNQRSPMHTSYTPTPAAMHAQLEPEYDVGTSSMSPEPLAPTAASPAGYQRLSTGSGLSSSFAYLVADEGVGIGYRGMPEV